MEFELMIPFGVVIIIFATIICRKYIFIKKNLKIFKNGLHYPIGCDIFS